MTPIATKSVIPWGDAGIGATLRTMVRLMRAGAKHPDVIAWAQEQVRHVPARDTDAEAQAMLAAVRRSLRYTRDPLEAEYVKAPDVSVREIRSTGVVVDDCDGAVTLLGSALMAIGIPAEPVVISQDRGTYTHVLLRYASQRHGWVALDPIVNQPAGWFPPDAVRVGAFDGSRIVPSSPGSIQGWPAPTARHVQAPWIAAPARQSAYVGACSPAGALGALAMPPAGGGDRDALARLSGRLEPYETLMWFAWATVSLVGGLYAMRRR